MINFVKSALLRLIDEKVDFHTSDRRRLAEWFSNTPPWKSYKPEQPPSGAIEVASTSYKFQRFSLFLDYYRGSDVSYQTSSVGEEQSLSFLLSGVASVTRKDGIRHVALSSEALLSRRSEVETWTIGGDIHRLAIRVDNDGARAKLENLLHQPVPDLDFSQHAELKEPRPRMFFEQMGLAFLHLNQDPMPDSSIWRQEQESMLLSQLVLLMPHSRSHLLLRPQAIPAPRTVRRAEEFMRAHAASAITLEMVASAAACSPRALQKAFAHFRQTTPLAYLHRIRLEIAHERLRKAEVQSIKELATSLGVSNPGRFARQFRSAYGYGPADLLKGLAR